MRSVSITSPAMVRILFALRNHGPLDHVQIIDKACIGPKTWSSYRRFLLKAQAIHVGGWKRSPGAGPFRPIFHFGPGEEAPKPEQKDPNIHKAAYRQRTRDYRDATQRLAKVDPVTASLMGLR